MLFEFEEVKAQKYKRCRQTCANSQGKRCDDGLVPISVVDCNHGDEVLYDQEQAGCHQNETRHLRVVPELFLFLHIEVDCAHSKGRHNAEGKCLAQTCKP